MSYPALKRLCDLFFAGVGLLILAPLGVVIALLVKLADGGPVFYQQTRVGQFGKPFRILKFRTMVVNAEQMGTALTSGGDPRVTSLGRVLRKTKLDELPQLWNVLMGQMSLVGPRPEVPQYVERYSAEQRTILRYKPGITDLASLSFRHEEELLSGCANLEEFYLRYCLPKKLELNRHYAERASLGGDLWLVLQTIVPPWLRAVLIYGLCLSAGFWLACQLKSDFGTGSGGWDQWMAFLPLMVFPQLLFLGWSGQLRGCLSYFSISELAKTIAALAAAGAVQGGICYSLRGRAVPGLSLVLLDFLLSLVVLCAFRIALRLLRERCVSTPQSLHPRPVRVALIGTGRLASELLLAFAPGRDPARRVVAIFDDDPRTWHKRPHDVPVVGMPECLLNRQWLKQIDEVIVTLPRERAARVQELGKMLKPLALRVTIAAEWPALEACPV